MSDDIDESLAKYLAIMIKDWHDRLAEIEAMDDAEMLAGDDDYGSPDMKQELLKEMREVQSRFERMVMQ